MGKIEYTYDYFNQMETPDFILCHLNKTRIGILRVEDRTLDAKKNDLSEISFTIHRYLDGELNPHYEKVEGLKYILLPDIGYFQITDCDITNQGEYNEYKSVTADSIECALGQKYLDTFIINEGTTGSIDGVQLYNPDDMDKSLLNLVLEKFPDWSIGYVDPDLMTLQRSFDVDSQDVYSFIMEDIADAFDCEFDFDTINNLINVTPVDAEPETSKLLVSYQNLLSQFKIEPDINSIKTCLTLKGEDDLTIREVNMGSDKIYNFDYYYSREWMSEDLYNAYGAWLELYNSLLDTYTEIYLEYMELVDEKYYLSDVMYPDDVNSEDWSEYCLAALEVFLASFEDIEDTMRKAENGYDEYNSDPDSVYQQMYLPNHKKLVAVQEEIEVREAQIQEVVDRIDEVKAELNDISTRAAIENNLTTEEYIELSKFIREDTLSDDNFLTTSIMSDAEIIEVKKQFAEYGKEELEKVAQPQFQVSANIATLFNIPEFHDYANDIQLGNYIYVMMREDYILKLRIIEFKISYDNANALSITFGNVYRSKCKNVYSDSADKIAAGANAATSMSINEAIWKNTASTVDGISESIENGLLSSNNVISTTHSEVVISERGIYLNAMPDSAYPDDSIFLGAGQIKFSSDGWATVESAIGRVEIEGVSTFGLIARAVMSGVIAGTDIIGGSITATTISNGNGTFYVDENGKMTCTDANIAGTVTMSDGGVGEWDVNSTSLVGDAIASDGSVYRVVFQPPLESDPENTEVLACMKSTNGGVSFTRYFTLYSDGSLEVGSLKISNTGAITLGNLQIGTTGDINTSNLSATNADITNLDISNIDTQDTTTSNLTATESATLNGVEIQSTSSGATPYTGTITTTNGTFRVENGLIVSD